MRNLSIKYKVNTRKEQIALKSDVQQGYCMSSILFNLYGGCLIKETLKDIGVFIVEYRRINIIKYVDYIWWCCPIRRKGCSR